MSPILPVRPAALAAAVAATCALVASAHADTIARGHVVSMEDREIYFSIAGSSGIKRGDSLRLKRPIQLKHPVTGKMVQDWLPLGTATVTMVGATMSMAVLDGALLSQVQLGDLVESLVLTEDKPAPPPAAPAKVEPEPPPEPLPEIDAHTRDVLAVWTATSGQRIEVRIGAWEDFLAHHPGTPYAAAIHEDLEILRGHRDRLQPPELELEDSLSGGLEHAAPTRGRAGEPLELAFLVEVPNLTAAWLHYRVRGTSSYQKGVLRREGLDYLRGAIPQDAVQGPGVEYFVEIATTRGAVGTAVGSPDRPVVVRVDSPPISNAFQATRNRSRVSVATTYLDFATFDDRPGDHTDRFYVLEADFLYRLHGLLYGVRTGFGVINGRGGRTDEVWSDVNPVRKAGFNYGYAELELRSRHKLALLARLVAGVGRSGFGLGAEGRFRLGDEDATNLSVGASRVAEIGFLTDIRMQWEAVENFPLGLAVALTDQPAQGDLGVRLTADFGYRALSWVQPTLRISYQGRTVTHAGLGAGLGLVFDW